MTAGPLVRTIPGIDSVGGRQVVQVRLEGIRWLGIRWGTTAPAAMVALGTFFALHGLPALVIAIFTLSQSWLLLLISVFALALATLMFIDAYFGFQLRQRRNTPQTW